MRIDWFALYGCDRSPDAPKAKDPLIIYTSRTHSQLKQVMQELKQTLYKPKTGILGSRDQFCVHADISKYKGNELNQRCKNFGTR